MQVVIFTAAIIFSTYCLRSAWRKYVGYNPTAPSLLARISKAISDPHPGQDESHSSTRYDR